MQLSLEYYTLYCSEDLLKTDDWFLKYACAVVTTNNSISATSTAYCLLDCWFFCLHKQYPNLEHFQIIIGHPMEHEIYLNIINYVNWFWVSLTSGIV